MTWVFTVIMETVEADSKLCCPSLQIRLQKAKRVGVINVLEVEESEQLKFLFFTFIFFFYLVVLHF
jgi:hypothetical protein